jgi:hypothetical protein
LQEAIDAHVDTATIFLALASPEFVASDYFDGPEWKRALDRVKQGEAKVLTVYLRRFDRDAKFWRNNPVSDWKPFPDPYDNLGEWVVDRDLDTMFTAVAAKLRAMLKEP